MTINLTPQTRSEMYLSSIDRSGSGVIPSRPLTRSEMYLNSINDEIKKKAEHIKMSFEDNKFIYNNQVIGYAGVSALVENPKNVVELYYGDHVLTLSSVTSNSIMFSNVVSENGGVFFKHASINSDEEIESGQSEVVTA